MGYFIFSLAVTGQTLIDIRRDSVRGDMNQAMALLARRSSASRSTVAGGPPKSSRSSDRDKGEVAVGVERSSEDVGEGGDRGPRAGKRARLEGEEESPRRTIARTALDPERFGPGKTLTITSSRKDLLPSILQGSAVPPLRIEMQSGERWMAGSNVPLQVFRAFDLPQDSSAYADKSREEIANRCLARGGRFLADLAHIVSDYREGSIRELTEAQEGRSAAEQRVRAMEKREDEHVAELGRVKSELEAARNAMKSIDKELEKSKSQIVENLREIEACRAEVTQERGAKMVLEKSVSDLKSELEKSEDVANGIETGYQGCFDRLKAAGYDLTGHSFEDYCSDLGKAMENEGEKKQDG